MLVKYYFCRYCILFKTVEHLTITARSQGQTAKPSKPTNWIIAHEAPFVNRFSKNYFYNLQAYIQQTSPTRKKTLTVFFHTIFPSESFGLSGFSTG